MSEKRFSYGRKNDLNFGYCPHCVRDLQEDKIFTDYTEIADLLNQLNNENEELLKKEKHLHKVITRKDERINNLVRNKEQLKKENEQLRKENNFLKQIREAFQIDVKNSR